MLVGWTVGEEALVDKNFICRIENCCAENESGLLSIDKNQWNELKNFSYNNSFSKDINMLE